jgi:hypothetical protein
MSQVDINLFGHFPSLAIRAWQCIRRVFPSRIGSLIVPMFLALLPIDFTRRIIRENWTSVPYYDEWWTPGGHIVSFLNGTLRLTDLFQQHNEARPLFPNLCNLLMTAVTGRWDVKDAMALMFVIVCLGSFLLLELLRQTTCLGLPSRLWAWALLNAVLFCPREYENFLWGTILLLFVPGVALLGALLISLSEIRLRWKVIANSALAFLATYSFANGMLLWLLAIPIYARPQGTRNRTVDSARWYALYALCGVISVAFYFLHYVHPRQHPPFATSLNDAMPLLQFLMLWIGSLFAVAGLNPFFFGLFFFGAFAALSLATITVARRKTDFRSFYPWIIIAAYALLSGAIVALGRVRFGPGFALASRYTAVSVFFYAGLAGLAVSLYNARIAAGHSIGPRIIFASGLTTGLLTVGWLTSFSTQLPHVKVIHEERTDLALAVQWILAIPLNPDLALAMESPKLVAERAIALSDYDALRPRLVPQSLASAVRKNPGPGDVSTGVLRSGWFSYDHRLLLTGKAWLSYRNARADCVVVGYVNSDGGLTPFTVFQPTYSRERLKGQFDVNRLPLNGFAASIDPANLPTGKLVLRAWAVDLKAQRLSGIPGAIIVYNEPFAPTVRALRQGGP